jgi:hypothetical protein
MSPCRWVAAEGVRIISRRHHEDCDGSAGGWHAPLPWEECRGCQPCTEPHCVVCNKEHADGACPDCLDDARSSLDIIAELVTALPDEVENRGVESEAMMLLGPVADPRTWHSHADTAARGLLCKCERRGEICPRTRGRMCPDLAAYLEDCRDELHPLWVLGTWEQVWRDHLDHQTDALVTLEAAISYLDMQMTFMSGMHGVDFKQFSTEIKACRAHLEDVLRDGIREETGAPCIKCERPMLRVVTEKGTEDSYECRHCHREVDGDQYRYAVSVVYRAWADCLTAIDAGELFGIKPSVIRVWGSRDLIQKRGRSPEGQILYDVADIERRSKAVDLDEAG